MCVCVRQKGALGTWAVGGYGPRRWTQADWRTLHSLDPVLRNIQTTVFTLHPATNRTLSSATLLQFPVHTGRIQTYLRARARVCVCVWCVMLRVCFTAMSFIYYLMRVGCLRNTTRNIHVRMNKLSWLYPVTALTLLAVSVALQYSPYVNTTSKTCWFAYCTMQSSRCL